MKNCKITLVFVALLLTTAAMGETYKSLWKKASDLAEKDLPKSEIAVMQTIQSKARKEKAYGQMISAGLKEINLWQMIAPDSLQPLFDRFVESRDKVDSPVLQTIYDAVIYKVVKNNSQLKVKQTFAAPLQSADESMLKTLAEMPTSAFSPLTEDGTLGKYLGNNMLSVIGYETDDFQSLYDYYNRTGNREAALLCRLEILKKAYMKYGTQYHSSAYKMHLDSLEQCYSDLDLCGIVAEERLNLMNACGDVTAKDKITVVRDALQRWPAYIGINDLKNEEKAMTASKLYLKTKQNVTLPNRDFWLMMTDVRNVQAVKVEIYGQNVSEKFEKTLAAHPDYEMFEDSIRIKGLAPGSYRIKVSTTPATEKNYSSEENLLVSDIYTVEEMLPDGKMRIAVLSATTGQPIGGAYMDVTYGYGDNVQKKSFVAPADGELIIDVTVAGRSLNSVHAYTDTDRYGGTADGRPSARFKINKPKIERTSIFTDRSIYRPGQTVHVSAITFTCEGDNTQAVSGKQQKITLLDANRQVIKTETRVTDEFGTVAADFILPTDAMNGSFLLQTGNANQQIRVEEYKRPTFEIIFPEITRKYKSGDTLMIYTKVRTFAGAPVQDAKVAYTVKRVQPLWWWRNRTADGGVLASDTVKTDIDGGCFIKMKLDMPEGEKSFYNFIADVTATSLNGETHGGRMVVPLGYKDAILQSDLKDKILRDSLRTVTFTLRNSAGKEVPAVVTYTLNGGKEQTAKTGVAVNVSADGIKIGKNVLRAVCEGDTLQQTFYVFGADDTKPCCETDGWFWVSNDFFPKNGKPVTVQVGSSEQNVHVLYTILTDNKLIEKGAFDVSNALWNRKFTYKDEYGDGIFVHFCWVKNGQWKEYDAKICKPLPEKTLKMEWVTFRDRLTPGQHEEWRLKVKSSDAAQLLCALYDKSLDQIYPHSWQMNLGLSRSVPYSFWRHTSGENWYGSFIANMKMSDGKQLTWNKFDDEFTTLRRFNFDIVPLAMARGGKMMSAKNVAMVQNDEKMYDFVGAFAAAKEEAGENPAADSNVRENLSETAFFYPQIQTDRNGTAVIKFTLPESLTTWRFMGLAHTKNLCYGMIENDIIAQKDVMIQPNIPRFIRMGDKATIATTIVNTSAKNLDGTAYFELIDPETQKILYSQQQKFSVNKGQTVPAVFTIDTDRLPADVQLYICRVHADGKGFSDGEQHYLPVLPDKEMVTNTYPVTQHGAGEKTVPLSILIPKSIDKANVTVEYVNNPAWMMVQALPSIATPTADDVMSYMRAYYSNKLAKNLLDANPKVKSSILQWKQMADKQAQTSPLTQNQELKNVLLNETPWIFDAEKETEWRSRMVTFFDENSLTNSLETCMTKIKSLQLEDGSWAWFKGMEGSSMMTLAVVESFVRLNILTGRQDNAEIISKGLRWLANETHKRVAEMKKNKNAYVSSFTLQYLYVCAIANISLPSEAKADNDWLLTALKKDVRNRTVFEKALTAIILNGRGERKLAQEYVQSLKELSVYREETGRYYDTPRAGYTWRDYKIPTEVAAIEAISRVTPEDAQTVEEMQRWLLQEKRTQFWATPMNCMDAVYAFMLNNSTALDYDTPVEILVDGKNMASSEKNALSLPLKKTKLSIERQSENVTFRKTTDGTGWGAVYAQFLQPIRDIDASASGITVTRTIQPQAYHVGDKVKVIITITADRDYDFVQVVDKRAACMEPVRQLSGYSKGCYISTKDCSTNYFILMLRKGTRTIETEYFVDRTGTYQYAPVTVQCAYAPEFSARSKTDIIEVQ